jgi:chitin disaccharide deacetylase
MIRILAVNGDDFGLTPGITRGILDAHTYGVLTHASLVASGPFAAEAIALARDTPSLSVGLHLVLVDGRPCLPTRLVPSLLDDGRCFRATAGAFVRDCVLARVARREVESELRAQIERALAGGIRPTHLDSHKHVHMWPPIFEIVTRLASEYGIPSVRVALERPVGRLLLETRRDPAARRQAVANLGMTPLAWMDTHRLAAARLTRTAFAGLAYTGILTPQRLAGLIARLPAGRTELMTHPGYVDDHLSAVTTRLRRERELELELLCSPDTRTLLERESVDLAQRGSERNTGGRSHSRPVCRKGHLCCES